MMKFIDAPHWRSKWFWVMAVSLAIIAGCTGGSQQKVLPLPEVPRGPIEMRVAYVVNPRLPRMDSTQLEILLDATKETSRVHFGVDLHFQKPVEISIVEFFEKIPSEKRHQVLEHIYDFKSGKGDQLRFEGAFERYLNAYGNPAGDILQYVRPYLERPVQPTYEAIGVALARLQLQGVERWKSIKALDGGPVIDSSPFNEFVLWDAIGHGDIPFELVLTNQIIASVEYVSPSVHTAIRGGYSNGVTTYSKSSRFKSTAVWSTFAFTGEGAWINQLRNGEAYGPEEAARLAGIGAAHEIGHQLFHLGHPYGKAACVMNPVPMLAFRAWAGDLKPHDCPVGSNQEMRPGASKIYY